MSPCMFAAKSGVLSGRPGGNCDGMRLPDWIMWCEDVCEIIPIILPLILFGSACKNRANY